MDEERFALLGAYVDYVDEQPTAAVSYRRRKHSITLFIRPATATAVAVPRDRSDRGFNVVTWRDRSLDYWAVSDLNGAELREFAMHVREGT